MKSNTLILGAVAIAAIAVALASGTLASFDKLPVIPADAPTVVMDEIVVFTPSTQSGPDAGTAISAR